MRFMRIMGCLFVFCLIAGFASAEFPELIIPRQAGTDLTPYLISPSNYYENDETGIWPSWNTPQSFLAVSAIEESGIVFLVGYCTEKGYTATISGNTGIIGSTKVDANGIFLYRLVGDDPWVRVSVGYLSKSVTIRQEIPKPTPDITLSPIEVPIGETRTYVTLGTSDRWPNIGEYVLFSGRLGVFGSRQMIADTPVNYEISEDGGMTYIPFDSVTTDEGGFYSFRLFVHEPGRVYIRTVFPGNEYYISSVSPVSQITAS